jgi:hypothetical protein
MKENEQGQANHHLDASSEANREKHINFREAEEENSGSFLVDKNLTERQKQWKPGIKEGEQERQNRGNNSPSAMPMDEYDTLGMP